MDASRVPEDMLNITTQQDEMKILQDYQRQGMLSNQAVFTNNISMAQIQIDANQSSQQQEGLQRDRLIRVKDVLKNSKTLKEQLKGVCQCYDTYVDV